ncbi:MAG: hypothetical protein GX383_07900, partial [Clostridium sp.]|nr:hypothetical protein [Clostridium sp.]
MKRLQVDAIAFLFIIGILGIANFINVNKPKVSEMENRALKQKPELKVSALLDGSYFRDYTEYYSDTFILRDRLLKISNDIQQALFIKDSDVKIIVSDKSKEYNKVPEATADKNEDEPSNPSDGTLPTQTPKPSFTSTPTKKPYNESDGVGYWIVIDGKAVELFKFNKDSFDFYAQVLNEYNQKIGGKMPIYSLIAPTNSEFVQLRNYKGITDSQNNAIAYLN